MAYGSISFLNKTTSNRREAPVRFSWTVLFFAFFPALFRKDMWGFLIVFGVTMITGGLSNLVFCFIYNKMYIKSLLEDGYLVVESDSYPDISDLEHKLKLELPTS